MVILNKISYSNIAKVLSKRIGFWKYPNNQKPTKKRVKGSGYSMYLLCILTMYAGLKITSVGEGFPHLSPSFAMLEVEFWQIRIKEVYVTRNI